MKFNRLAMIEKIKAKIEADNAKFIEDCAALGTAQATWESETVAHQRAKLNDLSDHLAKLTTLDRLLTRDDLPWVNEDKDSKWQRGDLDLLLANIPSEFPHPTLDGVTISSRPKAPVHTQENKLIAVLEAATDEDVTTNGLENLGFRNIGWVWS